MDIAITITADIATVVDIVTVADIATVVVVVTADAVAAKKFVRAARKARLRPGFFYVVVYRAKRAPGESMQGTAGWCASRQLPPRCGWSLLPAIDRDTEDKTWRRA
jgi:hypothetical protein